MLLSKPDDPLELSISMVCEELSRGSFAHNSVGGKGMVIFLGIGWFLSLSHKGFPYTYRSMFGRSTGLQQRSPWKMLSKEDQDAHALNALS